MDRRAVFFVCAAVVCAALIPLIPVEKGKPDITWVGWVTCGAFLFLAALSFLDHRARRRAED